MATKTAISKSAEKTGDGNKTSALYANLKIEENWWGIYHLFVVISLLRPLFYIVSNCSPFGKINTSKYGAVV